MNNLMFYFLPIIIILGIVTSYQDFKTAKIKNKNLIIAIVLGLILHTILIVLKIETTQQIIQQLTGTFLALVVGLFIWYIKWWSAGDAKLFTVYFFLIPVNAFSSSDITFRVMTLLINMILPIWIFLLTRAFIANRKSMKKIVRESLKPKNLLGILLLVLSIPWLIDIILRMVNMKSNFLISIAAMVLISNFLRKYGFWEIISYIAILLIRITLEYSEFFEIESLIITLFWILAYFVVRHIILLLMVTNIYDKNKRIKRENKIMKIMIREEGDIPFAPIMFLGVILTLLIGASLDSLLLNLLI